MSEIILGILLSWLLMLVSSGLFFSLRTVKHLKYGFGTELFALLAAVDFAVVLNVIQPACLLRHELPDHLIKILACVLLMATIALAVVAIHYEAQAQAARKSAGALNKRQRIEYIIAHWAGPIARAWTARLAAGSIHLMLIVKVPKWWG